MHLTWETVDWATLERLRATFLAEAASGCGSYWRSRSDLANYDFTYAQRIAWKWDAVLAELRARGWRPGSDEVLDWGCGSGVAGRQVVAFLGADRTSLLRVWDRSELAMDYAREAALAVHPTIRVEPAARAWLDGTDPVGVLVLSHVLNELSGDEQDRLERLIRRATAVLWVEPGTHSVSHDLIAMRERLRAEFAIVAPCPHDARCGMLAAGNERHWCHGFADSRPGIMADSGWAGFSRRMGIDLRRLPYSFLVLDRPPTIPEAAGAARSRIIGEPRFYTGYAKLLGCSADGVRELTLPKRVSPSFFKRLKRGEVQPPLCRWDAEDDRISALHEEPAEES